MSKLSVGDLMSLEQYHRERPDFRARVLAHKRNRQVAIGPNVTLYFEDRLTMQYQIQEMLRAERIFESEAIAEELEAYNPLIPKGRELVATVMFEIEDPVRRARLLGSLGEVETHFYFQVGDQRVPGVPESDTERSREDGKTSSVHFLRFGFTPNQIAAFRSGSDQVLIGCDDARYPHLAVLSAEARAELAKDFV